MAPESFYGIGMENIYKKNSKTEKRISEDSCILVGALMGGCYIITRERDKDSFETRVENKNLGHQISKCMAIAAIHASHFSKLSQLLQFITVLRLGGCSSCEQILATHIPCNRSPGHGATSSSNQNSKFKNL